MKKNKVGILITGLSGSGKTTIAEKISIDIQHYFKIDCDVIDGDLIRKKYPVVLGFSKEDRFLNIKNISNLAKDSLTKGKIPICATIAPYIEMRNILRTSIQSTATFVMVYLKTPIEVCESRDVKGLYKKARKGKIKNFTGISDIYEIPLNPQLTFDTSIHEISFISNKIIEFITNVTYYND
ncbi:MAG: adenylyl-sulfate kinase [Bacteroidota bacterium]